MHTDRNLVLGMLALQMRFLSPESLIEAMHSWMLAKSKSLGRILVEERGLSKERLAKLEALVDERLKADGMERETYELPTIPPTTSEKLPRSRYTNRRPHKRGGLGEVFIARDEEVHREVALKEIQNRFADDPDHRGRFVLEAEITGGLEHPGIVPVYGMGTYPDGRPFYAMRFIRGKSLHEAIQEFHKREGEKRDPAEHALALRGLLDRFLDVCNSIAYAHSRGVLHCDLKPSNIMLGKYGETLIVDWGLAQLMDPTEPKAETETTLLRPPSAKAVSTMAGGGTAAYMAPEQIECRREHIHICTDIYALGGILFEILSGQPPHTDKNRGPEAPRPRSVRLSVPAALDAMVARALSPQPADRHVSVLALAEELQRWLAEEPITTYRAFIDEFEKRVRSQPDSPDYREHLARNHTNLGLVLDGVGRHAESEQAYQAAIHAYEQLLLRYPAEARYRAELATCRIHFSRVLAALGREKEAQQTRQASVADYKMLMAANPHDYRTNLASVMITLMPDAQRLHVPIEEQPSLPYPAEGAASRDDEGHLITVAPEAGTSEREEAPSPPELPVQLRSRFTLIQQVGRGGTGIVWSARDNDLNRKVAIKLASEGLENNPKARLRFLKEAQITVQLEHPNIVPIYGLGYRSQDGAPFVIMRFVSGGTLKDAISDYHDRGAADPKAFRRVLEIYTEACRGVSFAHARGILHRDPKPSNILRGDKGEVFVVDWGLAKLIDDHQDEDPLQLSEWADPGLTHEGAVMGTPAYMAPEVARGDHTRISIRTDVYGLGATLFHLLTGRVPYQQEGTIFEMLERIREGPTPLARSVNPTVSPALEAICAHAMSFRPEDRYATVDELRQDVLSWLAGEPISVYPETRMRRLTRLLWSRPNA